MVHVRYLGVLRGVIMSFGFCRAFVMIERRWDIVRECDGRSLDRRLQEFEGIAQPVRICLRVSV
jgi:hypothetical protein